MMMTLRRREIGELVLFKGFLLMLLLASLGGCSLWNGGSAKPIVPDLGANVAVLGVRQAWTARIGKVGGLPLDIHSSGNVVTLASEDGVVAAIDARKGGDLWRTLLAEPLSAGVGSDGNTAAVVSRSNALIVLNAGRERWRQTLSAQVFTPPLVAGGRVFVLSADRSISAYDTDNGR